MTTDELRARVEEVLAGEEGDALERYRRWSALQNMSEPLVMLIGGAPGTGKSTSRRRSPTAWASRASSPRTPCGR